MMLLLTACVPSGSTCTDCSWVSTSPSDTVTPPGTGPTAATGETGQTPTDTGWTTTGLELATTVGTFTQCPATSGTYGLAALEVSAVAADQVTIARSGPFEGCGFPTALRAGLDQANATIHLHWVTGDCDAIWCLIGSAQISGVPSGTWTIDDPAPGALLTTEVTVP